MKIRKATPTDLDILLRLYDSARRFMAAHGNPTQWGTAYPPRTLLESDIAEGCSYICEEQQKELEQEPIQLEPWDPMGSLA